MSLSLSLTVVTLLCLLFSTTRLIGVIGAALLVSIHPVQSVVLAIVVLIGLLLVRHYL